MMATADQLVEGKLAGETVIFGENVPQHHSVYHKFHMTRPGLQPRQPRWEASDYLPELWLGSSMPKVGFVSTITMCERAKTVHALDRGATVTGYFSGLYDIISQKIVPFITTAVNISICTFNYQLYFFISLVVVHDFEMYLRASFRFTYNV
jgi:hypothetical protein